MLNLYNAKIDALNGLNGVKDLPGRANPGFKSGFEKYVDASGDFPTSEFKWSIWYVKNRLLLYKILVGVLIGISSTLWLFSLWKWGDFLIFGWDEMNRISQQLAVAPNYTNLHALVTARPLDVEEVYVFAGNGNKVDAVTTVYNPNEKFTAEFDYYFVLGGVSTSVQRAFILAGENKPVVQLGLDGEIFSGPATLVIQNLAWHRISGHKISNPIAYQQQRLDFTINDFEYISKGTGKVGDSSAIQFKLKNESAYSYSAPKFLVAMYENQNLVGVVPLELDMLTAQESKDVDIRTFPPGFNITEIQLFPLINLYNEEVYLQPAK